MFTTLSSNCPSTSTVYKVSYKMKLFYVSLLITLEPVRRVMSVCILPYESKAGVAVHSLEPFYGILVKFIFVHHIFCAKLLFHDVPLVSY